MLPTLCAIELNSSKLPFRFGVWTQSGTSSGFGSKESGGTFSSAMGKGRIPEATFLHAGSEIWSLQRSGGFPELGGPQYRLQKAPLLVAGTHTPTLGEPQEPEGRQQGHGAGFYLVLRRDHGNRFLLQCLSDTAYTVASMKEWVKEWAPGRTCDPFSWGNPKSGPLIVVLEASILFPIIVSGTHPLNPEPQTLNPTP